MQLELDATEEELTALIAEAHAAVGKARNMIRPTDITLKDYMHHAGVGKTTAREHFAELDATDEWESLTAYDLVRARYYRVLRKVTPPEEA